MNFDERSRKHRTVNSREQDLFLLAKGHYDGDRCFRRAEAVRRLVAVHNGVLIDHMRWGDVLHVVLADLGPIITPNLGPHRFRDFMMSLVPHPVKLLGPDYDQDGGVCAVIIDRILSEVCQTAVLDDAGQWCMPFPRPAVDVELKTLLCETEPAVMPA